MNQRVCTGISAISLLLAPNLCYAQVSDPDEAKAQQLYHEASADFKVGAFERACPKFEASFQFKPEHLRTAISLASCYDKIGRTADAWTWLSKTRGRAAAVDDTKKVEEIDRLKADLKSRLVRIRINVPQHIKNIPDLTISCGDIPISYAKLGESIIINPGRYRIKVSAPNRETWSSEEYNVSIGGSSIDIPVSPDWNLDESHEVRPNKPPPPPPRSGLRTTGFVGLGIGAAALVTGGIFGGLALSKKADSNADGHCDASSACDEIGTSLRLEAKNLGNASTALLIGGGVLALGGIILVATAPAKKPIDGVQASLWVGAGSIGVWGQW